MANSKGKYIIVLTAQLKHIRYMITENKSSKISPSTAKQHISICKSDVIAVNAENAFTKRTPFYPVTIEGQTVCQHILSTG